MSDNETDRIRNSVQIDGKAETPGTTAITTVLKDVSGNVLFGSGATVPNAETGYAKGCLFIESDLGNGVKALYENIGTTTACSFSKVSDLTGAEIQALAVTTAKLANDAVTVAKLDEALLKYTDVELTAAQIKALLATPQVLVAEAGAGYAILPMSVSLKMDSGTEVLSETADNLCIKYSGGAEAMEIETTGLIDQAGDQDRYQGVAEAVLTPVANTALVIANKGNGEFAGNATNDAKLYVRTFYRIIPVL